MNEFNSIASNKKKANEIFKNQYPFPNNYSQNIGKHLIFEKNSISHFEFFVVQNKHNFRETTKISMIVPTALLKGV